MSGGRIALEVVRWALGWWLLWRLPRPSPSKETDLEGVTVVVPARNEADNLGRLLPSLAASGVEVVVVDDQSSDGTGDVARRHGARVVTTEGPPDGWTGKAWACATGAEAAVGDVLVFLDADVVVEPGGLDAVVAEQRGGGGLVSVLPWHDVPRPHEQLSAMFNLVAPMAVDAFSPVGGRRRARGAFGPCIAVDRDLYERSGGHGATNVRGAVLDDVELARAVQAAGADVHLFGGRGSGLRFRMYPTGLAPLVEGWTKNFAGGATATRPLTVLFIVAWLSGLIAAPFEPGPFGLVYAAYAAQFLVLLRRVGGYSPLTALAFPIPVAFFVAVFARSAVRTFVRREVRWRGRTLRT